MQGRRNSQIRRACTTDDILAAGSDSTGQLRRNSLGQKRDCQWKNGVEFASWSPSLAQSLGKTIHYKGFAARVNFADEDTQKCKRDVLQYFKAERPDTVVWDGDSYQEDSFTAMIPDIYDKIHPRLVMFLRDDPEDKKRVLETWSPTGLPILCYLLSAQLNFEQLGREALQATQSKKVLCFGGGGVLEQEYLYYYQTAPEDIEFVLVCTRREGQPSPLEAGLKKNLEHGAGRGRRASLTNVDAENIAYKMT